MAEQDQCTKSIWLHIGAPKTGSTAAQSFCLNSRKFLVQRGVELVRRRRRATVNDLAVAIRSGKLKQAEQIGADVDAIVQASAQEKVLITSEMLSGCNPKLVSRVIPCLSQHPVNLIFYIRRQDQMLESSYKQKIKTGRLACNFQEYLEKFQAAKGFYDRVIDSWSENFPDARWHVRRMQRGSLYQEDVVADFMQVLGVSDIPEDILPKRKSNVSPNIDVLEVLRQMTLAGDLNIRKIQQVLSRRGFPECGSEGRIISDQEARGVLAMFKQTNETIRARFFPDEERLFDENELADANAATPSFNPDQLNLIREIFQAVSTVHALPA